MKFLSLIFAGILILTGCDSENHYAPVAEINVIDPIPSSGKHKVLPKETIYEVAWRYGLDYQQIVEQNQLAPPFKLKIGQLLTLRPQAKPISKAVTVPKVEPVIVKNLTTIEPNYSTAKWIWPAKGRVINSFSASQKGINIAGMRGNAILASAAGKVVYCGNGLRGYGNLIIIKHNNLYLSAYAHNQTVFVQEGDWVEQGQKIAEMGNSGSSQVMLHFEVRRAGKPVNPIVLLNS